MKLYADIAALNVGMDFENNKGKKVTLQLFVETTDPDRTIHLKDEEGYVYKIDRTELETALQHLPGGSIPNTDLFPQFGSMGGGIGTCAKPAVMFRGATSEN